MKTKNNEEIVLALRRLQEAVVSYDRTSKALSEAGNKATTQQSWNERRSFRCLEDCRFELEELLLEDGK
jgi:hypothetical protein